MNAIYRIWGRRIVMIVIPLLLVALEWNHPVGFSKNVSQGLGPVAAWWKYLHVFQSFLFGGIAIGAVLLTCNINNFLGLLSKVFLWLFAVCYLVFDSTAGISVGYILETSQQNPHMDQNTINEVVQNLYNDRLIGGRSSYFSLTGSWSWLLGIATAIIAIFINNRQYPLWKLAPPLLLLMISAYSLYVGHYPPYGPIAFGCFAAASLWFEVFRFGPAS